MVLLVPKTARAMPRSSPGMARWVWGGRSSADWGVLWAAAENGANGVFVVPLPGVAAGWLGCCAGGGDGACQGFIVRIFCAVMILDFAYSGDMLCVCK